MKFNLPHKFFIPIWILFVSLCFSIFLFYPNSFTPRAIAEFVGKNADFLLPCYFAISILRGFTLIPNTPFVLAGTILFPQEPFLVLGISLIGIIFSSSMIFYFSDKLGFSRYITNKFPHKILKIQDKLQTSNGFFFIFLWSFFPVLPTDAVSYVAGTLKMSFVKFILALSLGELIICSIYIFFYSSLLNVL